MSRQNHDGMFITTDAGDTWQRIENGLPKSNLSTAPEQRVFGFPVEIDRKTGYAYSFPLEGNDFRYAHGGMLRVYRTCDDGISCR